MPGLTARERKRLLRLERKLARARRGSNRRGRVKLAIARLQARETDRRKDWAEKVSTDLARRFDVIRVEDLKIGNMTRSAKGSMERPGRNVRAKAGLNRGILRSGWGLLVRRLERQGTRKSREDQSCVHVADLLGLRAPRPGIEREPIEVPVPRLRPDGQRRRERGQEHRGGARRDCAGRRRGYPACEPRTSTAAPIGVAAGIPRLQAGEDVNVANDNSPPIISV